MRKNSISIIVLAMLMLSLVTAQTVAGEEQGFLVDDGILMNEVSGDNIFVASNMGCHPLKGTKVRIVDRQDYKGVTGFWIKAEILTGECTGATGWIDSKKFSY